MTEISFKDKSLGLEFTLECDLEKGELYAWHVVATSPLDLQNAINVPFLVRQAGTTPCAQKQAMATAAATQQRYPQPPQAPQHPDLPTTARVVKRVKLNPETGEPIPVTE